MSYTKLNISILVCLLLLVASVCVMQSHPKECFIEPMLEKLRQDLIKLDNGASRLQFFSGDESYTEDKERVYLCMKDENGKYYSYNTLIAVGIHELAHALSPVIDPEHTSKEFNEKHEELRKRAEEMGLLNVDDPVPHGYCPTSKKD